MMRTNGRRTMRALLVAMTMLALTMMPVAGRADDAAPVGATVQDDPAGGEVERWWGAMGAVVCGWEIRLMIRAPEIGWNPYAIAAGIAGCSLAALDVLTTN